MTKKQTIKTTWEIRTYDVWGNAKDGYEVNDSLVIARDYPLELEVKVYNEGTPREFVSAYPTDKQIREALDCKPRIKIESDGDDLSIYVRHAPTNYPLGEMFCTSHESLSPIRVKASTVAS